MCIISILPPLNIIKQEITKEILEKSWKSNIDGAGYSFIKTKHNHVCIKKGYFNFDNFYKSFLKDRDNHKDSVFMIHFRAASKGNKIVSNCHPFFINSNNAAMAHNGTIHKLKIDDKSIYSDSNHFAKFLNLLPKDWYYNCAYKLLIEKYIGDYNKIAILTKENKVVVFNESKWFKEEDIFYSSDYYKKERDEKSFPDNLDDEYWSSKCSKCYRKLNYPIEFKENLCIHCMN